MEQEFQQQPQQIEQNPNAPTPTPKPKSKLAIFIFVATIILIIEVIVIYLLVTEKQIPTEQNQNPVVSQTSLSNQFNSEELGILFSYPKKWGEVSKITSAHIHSKPFDLIHSFNFNSNPSISMSVKFLDEPEVFRQHADVLKEKSNPRQEFCKENLVYSAPKDNENPNKQHSAFRQFGTFSFGTCDYQYISFIGAKKVSDPSSLVEQDITAKSSQIEITKTYVIPVENLLYSPLFLTIKLSPIQSDDYCLTEMPNYPPPSQKKVMKSFSCITYGDKTLIENAITEFESSESNNKIQQLLGSMAISDVAKQNALNFVGSYFETKTSYFNDKLGIEFDYPTILPDPVLEENERSISIDDFEIVEVISRQDAANIEKSAAECEGMCFGPSITVEEWDLHLDILTKNIIDKEECSECVSITTMGNNKFLVLFQGKAGYSGHPGKRYITYQNGKRFEFNGFQNLFTLGTEFTLAEFNMMSEESLMQKIIKDIIVSTSFNE